MDDPSALIQFFDEINRRTDEAIADCAKTWVNQAARKRFHAAIHETVKTVFVALLNDLLELQRDLGEQILESEDAIPTVEQIAESLPRLFSEAGEGADDARKRSVERVKWVWTQWLQLQMRVHQLLPTV